MQVLALQQILTLPQGNRTVQIDRIATRVIRNAIGANMNCLPLIHGVMADGDRAPGGNHGNDFAIAFTGNRTAGLHGQPTLSQAHIATVDDGAFVLLDSDMIGMHAYRSILIRRDIGAGEHQK